jgi:hypothetical protein
MGTRASRQSSPGASVAMLKTKLNERCDQNETAG